MFRTKNAKTVIFSLILAVSLLAAPTFAKRPSKSGGNQAENRQAAAEKSTKREVTAPKSAATTVEKSNKFIPPQQADINVRQVQNQISLKPVNNKTIQQRDISATRVNRSTPVIGSARRETEPQQQPGKPQPALVIRQAPGPSNVSEPHSVTKVTEPSVPRPATSERTIIEVSNSTSSTPQLQTHSPVVTRKPNNLTIETHPPSTTASIISSDKITNISAQIEPAKGPAVESAKKLKTRPDKAPSTNNTADDARGPTSGQSPAPKKTTEQLIEKRTKQTNVTSRANIFGKFFQPGNSESLNQKVQKKSIIERIFGRKEAKKADNLDRGTVDRTVSAKPVPGNIVGTKIEVNNKRGSVLVARRKRGSELRRPYAKSKVIYEDRGHFDRDTHQYQHIYRDRHNRLCNRIIWPRFFFRVWYGWGPHIVYHYVYPYYHRRYVFVSLCGYWPIEYRYIRYYWYPCHYYYWYGYHPIAREIQGDTYNYYTYNYYGDGASTTEYDQVVNEISPVDETEGPEAETLADTYFDAAVEAFENGDYATAADRFAEAMELAPEDIILPFAYAQALFADEKYSDAAKVIRLALENVSAEQQGVFYPRGLYVDEDIIFAQIDRFAERAQQYPSNRDLQLLLGYQLLGIGQIEKSLEPLKQASIDPENATAASVLLDLAEKLMAENTEAENQ